MGLVKSTILLFQAFLSITFAVEVHFETPDSGFFLKHSPRQNALASSGVSSYSKTRLSNAETMLSLDRFTVVQTSQPVSVRASYGPFSTKQTVPARYIVPDVLETANTDRDPQNTTAALIDLQQGNLHLDISAHVVKTTIARDSPVLRVLFHAGADPGGHLQRQKICVLLHASLGDNPPLKGRCMPEGEDGVCVAEVVIPSNWWPPLTPPQREGRTTNVPLKSPQRIVQVSYSVFEPPARSPELCEPKVQIQPLTSFAKIPLTHSQLPYKELRADETLTIMVPQQSLYPLSKIHVPVFLHPAPGQNIAVFIVRARVKVGMRIIGAIASSDDWNVSVEKENSKHTVARVTAFRKDQDPDSPASMFRSDYLPSNNRIIEVFSWLLEVANDTKEHWDGGRVIWSVSYVHNGQKVKDLSIESVTSSNTATMQEEGRKKIVARLEIQKDDIQAVLPIAKNWELMNTAVLTGRQISQAMKVFIVSQAGKVADVTLQSSCQAEDESVIKVSSSCSSVYVDGSEVRGSSNASVLVKYGTYAGLARFTVWMPEFPLEVSVADFRLSQIKGWKIPEDHNTLNSKLRRRKKRAFSGDWRNSGDDLVNSVSTERSFCRARYQQSPVEVYARFLAVDQDSGRVSYLLSRRTGLRVTDLVQPLLRVADPKIATLRGHTLQGRAMGRTDVQVLSPINGRVIGAREVRVGSDKVTISRLMVKVVSGLQLAISGDGSIENGYIAETTVTRKLTAQYQEGLLDIDLEFSDGTRTPLRDISVDDYFLLVESLDTEVVAFAPMLASHHPRVIAVGEGNGDLLRVTLLLSEECRLRRNTPVSKQGMKTSIGPLVSALASVQVDFSASDMSTRPDTVQNDGVVGRDRNKSGRELTDLEDILIGIPFKNDKEHEITNVVPTRQHHRGSGIISTRNSGMVVGLTSNKSLVHSDATTLEIGMYIVLAAFCLAIAVFVVSCVVYASKYRPITIDVNGEASIRDGMGNASVFEAGKGNESCATNAHDWVWLGRATMDRSNAELGSRNNRDPRMHIISNPMNSKLSEADESLIQINRFDNPTHVQLAQTTPIPLQNNRPLVSGARGNSQVMSVTCGAYNKHDRHERRKIENVPMIPSTQTQATAVVDGIEYRPPVPPHRHWEEKSNSKLSVDAVVKIKDLRRSQQHHPRKSESGLNSRGCSATNPAFDIQMQNATLVQKNNGSQNQHQINPTLFSSGVQRLQYSAVIRSMAIPHSFENMGFSAVSSTTTDEPKVRSEEERITRDLHMAERLVEKQNAQDTAFKFDTIHHHQIFLQREKQQERHHVTRTPYHQAMPAVEAMAVVTERPGIENDCEKSKRKSDQKCNDSLAQAATKVDVISVCSLGKSGSFLSLSDSNIPKELNFDATESCVQHTSFPMVYSKKVNKKEPVVGNPMFSNSPDSELGPGESLGLDDLDMDYEQIMHYFDNLKESNA